LQDSDLLRM